MAFQISDQLRSFGLAILLGLAAGVVYDLLRTVRLRFPSFTGVLDLLYWLAARCPCSCCGRQTDSSGGSS